MTVIIEMNIDFELLKKQKLWLLNQPGEEAEGLIGIIDEIQDQAEAAGGKNIFEITETGEDY